MKKLIKELPIIAIIVLPAIYLATIWTTLSDKVPMHWNVNGEIDRYGSKNELLLLSIGLPLVIYILLTFIQKIDPKNNLDKMGNKFNRIKWIITIFVVALSCIIIYTSKQGTELKTNLIPIILGIFFLVLGNYFKTIKPNYFMGIRTAWTLENEVVWKKTHEFAGKLWFVGGIIIVLSSLVLDIKMSLVFLITVTAIITIIPIGYSYKLHNKLVVN